jgi:hypothetical protein
MRQATEADLQTIRELLAAAGGPRELIRWIKAASKKPRKRGRPPGDKWEAVDFWLLQEIDRRHAADRGKSVSHVISEVIAEKWQAGERVGASEEAVGRRLFSRIRPTVIRAKGAKITLSKPQFEFPLTRYVQPRARRPGGAIIGDDFVSGFRPPFFDLPSTIERPRPEYQPGSVEWQEQQDRAARTEKK